MTTFKHHYFWYNQTQLPLDVPARFVVKVKKPTSAFVKVNPVIWSVSANRWLAHTARRLPEAEFGEFCADVRNMDSKDYEDGRDDEDDDDAHRHEGHRGRNDQWDEKHDRDDNEDEYRKKSKFNKNFFDLKADEELVYFETPFLGLVNMMEFETQEKPSLFLPNFKYFREGKNTVQLELRGNYLRPERTRFWVNGVTANWVQQGSTGNRTAQIKTLSPLELMLFAQTPATVLSDAQNPPADFVSDVPANTQVMQFESNQFKAGSNQILIVAENLVNTVSASYTVQAGVGDLSIEEIYAFPSPARVRATPFIQFSYVLSRDADVNIKLYTPQGMLLKEFNALKGQPGGLANYNAIAWDGIDQYGNAVANGVYLYVITVKEGGRTVVEKRKFGILL